MNIKNLILGTCLTIATAITLVSCEGPAGAPGPQGITGTTGAAAPTPVAYPYTVNDTLWTANPTNTNQYTCHINDTNITHSLATYVVLVYAQGTTNSDYFPLPTTNLLATNDQLSYSYNDTAVTLYYSYTAGTTVAPTVPLNIEEVAVLTSVMKQHPNTNFGNYHEVMALLAELKAIKRD